MAEAGFDQRRLFLVAGVVVVIVTASLLFFLRGCSAPAAQKNRGYVVVYSNLELKDAANVVARLKELNIPYEIRDEGRSVAVIKDKADQARLGLAEKNLPMGGNVGWEIFNESKLGATDFDRRIQLIRAISGELARTIRCINGVADVRVQVVIPETKLFSTTSSPVTASIMLTLNPGVVLPPEKINGIVHLVASSVENLQPENVTVVDDYGRILTNRAVISLERQTYSALPPPPEENPVTINTPTTTTPTTEVVITKTATAAATKIMVVSPTTPKTTGETKTIVQTKEAVKGKGPSVFAKFFGPKAPAVTPEEKKIVKIKLRKDVEMELSGKAQELLNQFYPLNSVIVKVNAEMKPVKEKGLKSQELVIKKLTAIVLVDNRIDFTKNLKKSTYTTVAAAIEYNKKRGDRIIIQRVPFHLATLPQPPLKTQLTALGQSPEVTKAPVPKLARPFWAGLLTPGKLLIIIISLTAVLFILVIVTIISKVRGGTARQAQTEAMPQRASAPSYPSDKMSKLDQVRMGVEQNPEKVAELLKKWLSE